MLDERTQFKIHDNTGKFHQKFTFENTLQVRQNQDQKLVLKPW